MRRCYIGRRRETISLRASASGGLFAALASKTIHDGGVVFGAAWDSRKKSVTHLSARTDEELLPLLGSKYVPSDLSGSYDEIERALAQNLPVLFSGTPCLCAAVRRRFGNNPNLLICAVFCHSVPQSEVWRAYVCELEQKAGSALTGVRFTDKRLGWPKRVIAFSFSDSTKDFSECVDENPYMNAFFQGYSSRPSCLKCQFKAEKSGADLLIGDFWGFCASDEPAWCDGLGVSAAVCLTERGERALTSAALDLREVPFEKAIKGNVYFTQSISPNAAKRARFLLIYKEVGVARAFRLAHQDAWLIRLCRKGIRIVRALVRRFR